MLETWRHCKHFVQSGNGLTILLSNETFLTKNLQKCQAPNSQQYMTFLYILSKMCRYSAKLLNHCPVAQNVCGVFMIALYERSIRKRHVGKEKVSRIVFCWEVARCFQQRHLDLMTRLQCTCLCLSFTHLICRLIAPSSGTHVTRGSSGFKSCSFSKSKCSFMHILVCCMAVQLRQSFWNRVLVCWYWCNQS